MRISHVHCGVADLDGAVEWFARVCGVAPAFADERMAVLTFGDLSLILDKSKADSVATIGFHSVDCDGDFRTAIERGASSLKEPTDFGWGSRAAYVKGPGALTIEFEQLTT